MDAVRVRDGALVMFKRINNNDEWSAPEADSRSKFIP